MRHITIIFFLALFAINGYSKDIYITFSGAVDTIKIDSISAINLTTNKKVTLPGNGTLVLIDNSLQSSYYQRLSQSAWVFPNPYSQVITFEIKSKITQKITIRITDLSGQTVLQTTQKVSSGKKLFSVSCKNEGIYLATIQKSDGIESFKIIQTHPGFNIINQISGYRNELIDSQILKKTFSEEDGFLKSHAIEETMDNPFSMGYCTGNIILFHFYSGLNSTIITASPDSSMTIIPEFEKCIDFDNNSYPIVKIGEQTWMAKNLSTTHYNNGDVIPTNIIDSVWVKLKTGATAIYLNENKYLPIYGRLYNWFAIDDSRGVCPVGWHVNNENDWNTLLNFLGGPEIAGGKLKSTGTLYWKEPNFGADNSSGFSALPSSGRNNDGVLYNDGRDCYYWIAEEKDSTNGHNWYIYYNRPLMIKVFHNKVDGFAVRCVKDN